MRYAIMGLFMLASASVQAEQWTAAQLRREVRKVAVQVGVPPGIAEALVERESEFNPDAVNPNDPSYGIMQLQTRYLPWFAARFNDGRPIDPFDPAVSIRVGLRYLASLHAVCGDWWDTIASYNCGLSRVMRGDIPKSTYQYVRWIMWRADESD